MKVPGRTPGPRMHSVELGTGPAGSAGVFSAQLSVCWADPCSSPKSSVRGAKGVSVGCAIRMERSLQMGSLMETLVTPKFCSPNLLQSLSPRPRGHPQMWLWFSSWAPGVCHLPIALRTAESLGKTLFCSFLCGSCCPDQLPREP